MARYGYFLSSEELSSTRIVACAQQAESVGFDSVLVSDHFHPWLDSQGESPFVWGVLGAIAATTRHRITTGVTCPTIRIHPAILAQAAATTQQLAEGRFRFGIGSGENLNEHILGHRWPPVATRLEMLEEAVEVIRLLWEGGFVTHHGRYYTVENARIYTLPSEPPPVYVSGFGPEATALAARIGDGYINTSPDKELLQHYAEAGGQGPKLAAVKICYGQDEAAARKLAYERWKTSGVPGQLNQELAMPSHFEEASQLVTEEVVAHSITSGPDPERHVKAIKKYVDAGYDEIYIAQVGDDQEGFLKFFAEDLRPRLPS
jgi:G6PDH family F420-dependent oxidoreductase